MNWTYPGDVNPSILSSWRYAFYMVSPYETMFPSADLVPRYVDMMFSFFFLCCIVETFVQMTKGRKIIVAECLASLNSGILQECLRIYIRSFEVIIFSWFYNKYNLIILPWNSVWTWYLAYIIVDFWFYWMHRTTHEVNIIWAIHQAHHNFETISMTNGLRMCLLQPILNGLMYLPLALFIPPSVFFVHIQLSELYMFWIHSNVIPKLGFLEYVFNTPSHHRVHHGRNPKYIDKNYGGVLIIWDRLFNTFQVEEEEIAYGLTTQPNTLNPFSNQYGYWIDMFKKMNKVEGLKNKLFVLIMGPGWMPGKPRLGLHSDIPKITYPIIFNEPVISIKLKIYLVFHFIVMLLFYNQLMLNREQLTEFNKFYGVVILITTIATISFIGEKKWYGSIAEFGRCLAFLLLQNYISDALIKLEYANNILIKRIIQSIFTLSAILWSIILFRKFFLQTF